MPLPRPAVLVSLILSAQGLACASNAKVHGEWTLWSIDGLPSSEAFPSRLDLVGTFGTVTVREGQAWTETKTDSLTLSVLPDDEFRETTVSTSTLVMTADLLERISGRRWLGPDPARETSPPKRSITIGAWTTQGDTIVFALSRDQTIASIAASMRSLLPNVPEDSLRRVVEQSLLSTEIPARYRGVLDQDRLVLTDMNGRRLVLRKQDGT